MENLIHKQLVNFMLHIGPSVSLLISYIDTWEKPYSPNFDYYRLCVLLYY